MNIFQYVRSLVPSLEKRHILNDMRMLREDISDITLPGYSTAVSLLGDRALKSKQAVAFQTAFNQHVKQHRIRGSYLNVTHEVLLLALEQVDTIEDAIKKHFAKDIITSGITYRQANILRYGELLRFVSKYARLRLIVTTAAEVNVIRGNVAMMGKEISAPEQSWLDGNQIPFLAALNVILESSRDLARTLDNVPDIVADPDSASVMSNTVGLSKLDPKRMNRTGFQGNPIYHLRMIWEDVMTAEYEAALEERRILELLLLDYEQAEEGTEDAKLQSNIESTRNRIETLKFRIEKREREAKEDENK